MEKLSKEQESIIFEGFDNSDTNEQFETFLKEKGLIEEAFEVGEYYKLDEDNSCFAQYTDNHNGVGVRPGCGEWSKCIFMSDISLWTKMTPEEIQSALTKEFRKRYKKGDKVKGCKSLNFSGGILIVSESHDYDFSNNDFFVDEYCVMSKGIWADIIEEEKEEFKPFNISYNSESGEVTINGEKYIKQ